jgi:hypothetical protein
MIVIQFISVFLSEVRRQPNEVEGPQHSLQNRGCRNHSHHALHS